MVQAERMVGDAAVSAERGMRLHSVLGAIGYHGPEPVPLPSDSNDAWRLGDAVLRICYRGDLARFEREAQVTAALPASVQGPRLLDHGKDAEVAWQVGAWIDGITLPRLGQHSIRTIADAQSRS
jgi:hypothetical protein